VEIEPKENAIGLVPAQVDPHVSKHAGRWTRLSLYEILAQTAGGTENHHHHLLFMIEQLNIKLYSQKGQVAACQDHGFTT
jgi:hypothetical protein